MQYVSQNYKHWLKYTEPLYPTGNRFEGPVFIYRRVHADACVQSVWMEGGSSRTFTFQVSTGNNGILSARLGSSHEETGSILPQIIEYPVRNTQPRRHNLFVRYIKAKPRWIFPPRIVASAGPHRLPPGDRGSAGDVSPLSSEVRKTTSLLIQHRLTCIISYLHIFFRSRNKEWTPSILLNPCHPYHELVPSV